MFPEFENRPPTLSTTFLLLLGGMLTVVVPFVGVPLLVIVIVRWLGWRGRVKAGRAEDAHIAAEKQHADDLRFYRTLK